MGNPYTSQSISGYNSSPPPDDGTNSSANEVTWVKHKTKIGDPLKTFAEAINTAVTSAFASIFGANVSSTGGSYTVQSSDQGKLIRITGAGTITTPTAATEGAPFIFGVKNEHSAAITIEGAGSENVDGSANISLPAGSTVILATDGADWYTFNPYGSAAIKDVGVDDGEVLSATQAQADVASGATTNIGAASSDYVRITGTTTITAFDTVAAGLSRRVRFADSLTLTHNGTSLILPGSANITTAADDTAEFISLGSGNWICLWYKNADGAAIGAPTAAQGASVVLLASYSPSAAASVDVTSVLTSTYKRYRIELYDFVPASDDVELWMRTSTDNSTFDSGASDYAYRTEQTTAGGSDVGVGDTAGSKIVLAGGDAVGDGVGSGAGEAVHVTVELYNPLGTALNKVISWSGAFQRASTALLITVDGRGSRLATADIDAVQFLFESGNIESGEVRVYGIKDS